MTSSSAIEIGLAFALACAVFGCAEQPIEETQTLIFAESEACRLSAGAGGTINHYRAFLFAFTGFDESSEEAPCVNCVRTGRCPIVDVSCGCTAPHPPLTGPVNQRIGGLRFAGVEPDRAYCIGLVGLDDTASTLAPGDPSESCACVEPSMDSPVRACGISPFPGVVEENAGAIFVSLECGRTCSFLMP